MDADGGAVCGSFVEGTLPSPDTEDMGPSLGERMGGGAADAEPAPVTTTTLPAKS